jgi:hypothetical protein
MNGCIRMAAALLGLAVSAATVNAQCASCPNGATPVAGTCETGSCGSTASCAGGRHKANKSPSVLDLTGHNNRDLYDRCWFVRYSNLAHRAVNRAMTPQVQNGHVLDQTVWNHMFEPGTDVLNPMGQAHLQYISRRRPEVDKTVYLATAMDLAYDPACPERYCGARQELDSLRVAAIQKFLTGLNCGRCQDFHVLVHDPADPTISTQGAAIAVQLMYARYRGGLATGAGGAGGAAGPSGSVGGFAGAGGAAGR